MSMKTKSYIQEAIALRRAGYSYSLIQERIPVARSTLSRWLADIPFIPNHEVEQRIGRALAAAIAAKHKLKEASYKEARLLARADLRKHPHQSFLLLGLGLYMGEGEKNNNVGLANADAEIIKLFIRWLKTCYRVDISHLTLAVHAYTDTDVWTVEAYWSEQTGIPRQQFGKTQIDRRKKGNRMKHKRLPYGTAHVRVRSNGKKEFGVLLSRRIEESIKLLSKNIAGVM